MKIYKFKVFYEIESEHHQNRYVIAENEFEAIYKIHSYFDSISNEGFMKPCLIGSPLVEIENVVY